MKARFESIADAHELAALIAETVSAGMAVFSDSGSLVLANGRFLQAVGFEPQAGESRSSLLLRAFGQESPAGEVRRGNEVFRCRVQTMSSGASVVWLEELKREGHAQRHSAYLSIASHDIRAPLANTRSYASLLLSPKMELNERARHCIEVILRNADRALALLQEFLDASLDEVGALDLDLSREDILPVIRECVDRARAAAEQKSVRINVQLPATLPPILVDRGRLIHALGAYLGQAVARSSAGQVIRLEVQRQPKGIYVAVSDSGTAEPGTEQTLFEREQRAIDEGKLGEGFRLGLAKAEIEAQGGQVGAQLSATGATFFFTLPLQQC
jgi:signal transduction histidine kinase